MYANLNPEKALIWRIVHKDNVAWIFQNGLHCGTSDVLDPNWINMGNEELIERRTSRVVPIPPYGTLNDYVPFYFTPFSPMMYNIHSGYGGVARRSNEDIVILVANLHDVNSSGLDYVFTDKHAYTATTNFYNQPQDLTRVDWALLQNRDFKRDNNDPAKMERYQAEALIHQHLPVSSLMGVVCYTDQVKEMLETKAAENGLNLSIHCIPGWYF